ncbi:MAG: hypothetical protein VB959_09015 [Rhodospirillales bacterium]
MIISVINHSGLSDEEVQSAIRAVNRQIAEDFEPHWSMGATLRLEGRLTEDPDLRLMAMNMRGDAILYLEDAFNPDDSPLTTPEFLMALSIRNSPISSASPGR